MNPWFLSLIGRKLTKIEALALCSELEQNQYQNGTVGVISVAR